MSEPSFDPPPERRAWTEEYGALTLDTCFSAETLSTSTSTPYSDLASLVAHARGILELHRDGHYHAFHSGLDADIVVTTSSVFLWFGDRTEPLSELSEADTLVLREDAVLREVAGIVEAQGIEASFDAVARALELASGRDELLQFIEPLIGVGKFSLAGEIIDARLADDPDDIAALTEDAQITMNLVATGQWGAEHLDQAEERLAHVLRLSPKDLRARLMWCDLPRYGGDAQASVPRFEELLAGEPECDAAHYNLAAIFLPVDPARALTHFEHGQRLAPDDADYPIGRARALAALGRTQEARQALDEGRSLEPDHPRIEELEKALE